MPGDELEVTPQSIYRMGTDPVVLMTMHLTWTTKTVPMSCLLLISKALAEPPVLWIRKLMSI